MSGVVSRRLWIAAAVVLVLALLAFLGWRFAASWRPSIDRFPVQGVDVSEDQGPINWYAAKGARIKFAYARATIGADRRDERFADNWHALEEAKIPRGAIHVWSLCRPAADQARLFITTVPRTPDPLPPALELGFDPDCKTRPGREETLAEIERFLAAIETHMGKGAVLKVTREFEGEYQVTRSIARPVWGVQTFFEPGYAARPWTLWQASGFRRAAGFDKPVNWDVRAAE